MTFPNACSYFACSDGQEVRVTAECDGFSHCGDGSDEHAGCPADIYFVCNDGTKVPAQWECDGYADCADTSDEHQGCPPTPQVQICP